MADDIVTRYRVNVSELISDIDALDAQYKRADKSGTDSAQRVSAAYQKQSDVINSIQKNIEKLQASRAKLDDQKSIDRVNKAIAQQSALLLKQQSALSKIDSFYKQQVGLIENLRNRINALTVARDKADNPERITRINKLIADQQKRVDGLANSLGDVEPKTNKLAGMFEKIGSAIAGAFAIEKIIAFGEKSIEEFAKSEQAVNALKFSVENLGGENEKAFKSLISNAAQLADVSVFSKDEIIKSQQLQSQFGLTAEQIAQLQPRILDLATALGTDLNSATETALSAITGTTRGLKQINGDFADTGSQVKNYNELIRVLGNVNGAAANDLDTVSGALRKQQNEANDLEQAIGKRLAPALVNLKRVALDVAADFVDLFFPESAKDKFKKNVDAVVGILESDTKSTVASLTAELETAQNKAAEKLAEKNRLSKQVNSQVFVSKTDSDNLIRVSKEYEQIALNVEALKVAIEKKTEAEKQAAIEAVRTAEIQKLAATDLTKMSSQELDAFIKAVKLRQDAKRGEVADIISAAEKQFDKTKALEESAKNDAISKRKDAIEQLKQMNDKYNAERLQSFAKTELDSLEVSRNVEIARAKLLFAKAGGKIDKSGNAVGDPSVIKEFNELVANINATYDEKISDNRIKKALETQQQLRDINEQNLADDLNFTLGVQDILASKQINALKLAFAKKRNVTVADEIKLANDILAIQQNTENVKAAEKIRFVDLSAEREKQRIQKTGDDLISLEKTAFEKRGDNSEGAEQRLADRIAEINEDVARKKAEIDNKSATEKEKINQDLEKSEQQAAQTSVDNFKLSEEEKLQFRKEIFDRSVDLINAMFDIENAFHQAKIDNLEFEKQKNSEFYDGELQKLDDNLNNRILSQAQYNIQVKKLKDKEAADQRALQQKINEEKHKQDVANRIRSLFEIQLNTAIAITKTASATPYPYNIPLTILTAALGSAQTALVLATPLPKYEHGVKKLQRKNGEPIGTDTIPILANEGERIIPKKQNVRHWKVYESIDDGKFDEYVHENYVVPALLHAKRKQLKQHDENFADNIVRSLTLNANPGSKTSDDQFMYDLMRMFNNGVRISNIDQLAALMRDAKTKSIYTS